LQAVQGALSEYLTPSQRNFILYWIIPYTLWKLPHLWNYCLGCLQCRCHNQRAPRSLADSWF
jgi:hypothetical protein